MNNTVTTGPRWCRGTWTIGALLLTALVLLVAACGDDDNGAAEDISGTAECDAEPAIFTTDDGVEFVRTPDSCFEDLPDFPYEPNYVEIDGMRQAYVDEGPADGEVVLLLHGQPSWSYLYRDMIPVFADAGYRVIAMDHLGMGRSDKPINIEDYSYNGHSERLETFVQELGLTDINLFGADTVGLVDPSQGIWYLRSTFGSVTSFLYGNPGDLPIAGDWDGDGEATPGLYRQSDGFFYSRNSNTTGVAAAECFAGDPSDLPIAGDWDGDGDDNLGIYRPSEQMFYLYTSTCTGSPMGAAQISFLFGNPGDKPVAGDWDGDGIDEVGLHRESTGFFYWRNTLDTGVASDEIFFGDPGDRFVAGDWGTVDGKDTPGLFRPSDVTFYFRHTLTQGVADSQFTWTGAGSSWLPVAGDFGLG